MIIKKPYTIFNFSIDNEEFLSVLLKHCEETIVDGHRRVQGMMVGPLDLILAEINVGVKIGLPYVTVFDRKSKQKYIVYIDRNRCKKIYYEIKKRKL